MGNRKVGIAYVPVLLSLTFECDAHEDAQMQAKEVMLSVFEELQQAEYGVGNATFEFYTLDWLAGSYMDQVREIEVADDSEEDPQESSSENG